MTLEANNFIRRFLLHVLPPGFHRIRYYELFGNRHRATAALIRREQGPGLAAKMNESLDSDALVKHRVGRMRLPRPGAARWSGVSW